MNCFAGKIAWRYLFSKKGHNAINIVSGVSAVAVAVVTAAMVCVLSVMNGFGVVVEQMFSEFDPQLEVKPAHGTVIRMDAPEIQELCQMSEVAMVGQQIREQALVEYKGHQVPAVLLGVDSCFQRMTHIDSIIVDGTYCVYDGAFERCMMGRGLAAAIGINAHFVGGVHIYAPKRTERVNMVRPDKSFNTGTAYIAGCFAVNQVQYDDQVMLVSLPMARHLFDYDSLTISNLAIRLRSDCNPVKAQKTITNILGSQYQVLNRYEQQADFYRIMRMEKLLTALLLVFILLIASFNVIGSLSMVMIDKKNDIRVLSNLGANQRTIRGIFLVEGWLTGGLGAILGLLTGLLICVGQEHYGWLKLGGGTEFVLSAYPVHVETTDILYVTLIVLAVNFAAAWYPTRKIEIE